MDKFVVEISFSSTPNLLIASIAFVKILLFFYNESSATISKVFTEKLITTTSGSKLTTAVP